MIDLCDANENEIKQLPDGSESERENKKKKKQNWSKKQKRWGAEKSWK